MSNSVIYDEGVNTSKSHPYQRRNTNSSVKNATSDACEVFLPKTKWESVKNVLVTFYQFSRVYTLLGSTISIVSVSLLVVEKFSDFTPLYFFGVLQAVVGGVFVNMYVASTNQISDVEIDKVNKPYLPLVSGKISMKTATLLAYLYAIVVILLACIVSSWPLKLCLFTWLFIATGYSVNVPLLRWKKVPILTTLSISFSYGVVIPILFYLHAQTYACGRPPMLSKHIIFVSAFMTNHTVVLSLFKDIPDVEGDKMNGVRTFAMQLGQKRVFWICIWLLEFAYIVATLIGLSSPNLWIKGIMGLSHSISGIMIWKKANLVAVKDNVATQSFYMFFWKLYYVEYLLIPILRF